MKKLTAEAKAAIVAKVELKLKPFIIGRACLVDCRCFDCQDEFILKQGLLAGGGR